MCYPHGAYSIDIQVPDRPRSLLFTPCRYDYASPSATDFLDQKKTAMECAVRLKQTEIMAARAGARFDREESARELRETLDAIAIPRRVRLA